ncbi:MAG: hypothetical protein GC204_20210 [Chloroflexi bacterium]|nr:hypothetical protein [Chloroflexota bacterium]
MIQDSQNQHLQYPDFSRHWCDTSEKFAGGDALLTAMQNHWKADDTCYEEHYWHAGTRLVVIYHFDLHNEGETLHMPVITNPYVRKIVREQQFTIKPLSREQSSQRTRYEGQA